MLYSKALGTRTSPSMYTVMLGPHLGPDKIILSLVLGGYCFMIPDLLPPTPDPQEPRKNMNTSARYSFI